MWSRSHRHRSLWSVTPSKSDIQPIIEIGGYGIHIPFHTMWRHEVTEEFEHPNITRLDSFEELTKMFIDNE